MPPVIDARSGSAVDRRAGLTARQFASQDLRALKPVILTDAIDAWPARARWSLGFFATRYGTRTVTVDGREWRLGDLIEAVLRSTAERPAPYLRNLLLESWAPELLADVRPAPSCTQPNWLDSRLFPDHQTLTSIELYIGGAGAAFPVLHYDNLHTHAFLMQIAGTKEYAFFPPEDTPYLYRRTGTEANKSSVDDIEHPDLARFPLFARASATRCRLEPGETLFVPSGWWHTARILSPSITVSMNTANATNWRAFTRDYVTSIAQHRPAWRARAIGMYLLALGVCESVASLWL